ncbi:MAG TPA: arginine--tRNA ligase [Dongiaceae bacterium]|nr:arginine--tRNA ligase [Dongiaceae bacterium]
MEALKDESARLIRDLAERLFGAAPEKVVVEYPPRPDMGDLASPVAFELARRLKRPPRAIAQELATALPRPAWLARVEAGGAGYLNLYVDRTAALRALAREVADLPPPGPIVESIIVEHTNINPNKAAHIGHLRNAVLGDSLARMLRFLGHKVEVQNYIDDTGVQVADVLIGFREILGWGLAEARGITEPLDRFCWDLYAKVTEMYEREPAKRAMQAAMLKELEERSGETGAFADWLTRALVGCHLDTMRRIGVHYDLLPWEGDILALKFWETAFDLLKRSGAIVRLESGDRAGCWVMALESDKFAELKEAEKIIVRSNGTVTYVGKDIAYQMWKFGLLPRDFHYDLFREAGEDRVWTSTRVAGRADHPAFGRADRVYNVIDVRQSYLQAIVAEGLRALGHASQAARSVHFAYEMVALTPKSATRLGVTLSEEDRARPYVGMSGRKGLGVKADDLLDALEAEALREVRARHAALPEPEARALAHAIAVGALRYFMIKYTRNKVLAFDFDEALSFEGETGPYLQYAVVRARGIFEKMAAQGGPTEADAAAWAAAATFDVPEGPDAEEHWSLVTQIARFRETTAQAIGGLELSLLAKYGFALAQRFNTFYHRYPVMKEPDERWRRARVVLTWLFIAQMRRACDLMGIPLPDRM